MKDYIKKYWYVGLISIVFIAGIIAVIVNSQTGVVSGKKADGKDVVYSINNTNVTADELYEELKDRYEAPLAAMVFEREVLSRTYDYTEDQKVEAKLESDQTIAYYKSQLGEEKAQELIEQILQSMGYSKDSELVDYYLNASAAVTLVEDYFESEYKDDFIEKENPVIMSHILVSVPQDSTMSEAEQERYVEEKMAEVDEALKTDDFATVATEYSTDTYSAQQQGSLGLVYKSIQFHDEFKDAAFKLEVGEISDWVESPSGFHKILITSNDFADVSADASYLQLLEQLYPSLKGEALFKQAEILNFDFSDNPEFEAQLRTSYGLGE